METIIISKEEYEKLKKQSEVDWELVRKIRRALLNIKEGRIKEWKDN